MKKNYLIFSPIAKTWPQNYNNNLSIVSESAILNLYGKQNRFKNIYINSPRWKNKKILEKDFNRLSNFFEKILNIISKELNLIHNEQHDYRTWRLILGPWLSMFIFIFFERYSNVKNIIQKKKIDKSIFLGLNKNFFIPYDAREFLNFTKNDLWNQFLYQSIAAEFIDKKKIIKKKFYFNNLDLRHSPKKYNKLKNILIDCLNLFDRRKYEYLLCSNNLGIFNEFNLSLRFNQFPILEVKNKDFIKRIINHSLREKIRSKIKFKNKFENICFKAICNFLPSLFLENYQDLNLYVKNMNLPTNPKAIFTSHSIWYETKFIFYLANLLKNKKTKLIYGQHGGTYGLAKYNWPEKFETSIADKYLSWGWSDKKNNIIKKFFIFKNLKIKSLKKKDLLIVMRNRQRYFFSMESSIASEVYSEYISNISKFLNSIENNLKKQVVMRLPPNSSIKNNFCEKLMKNYKFYNNDSFSNACSKSKLIIHTFNSTPFLETFSSNIPSILILDKNDNPFKSEYKILMDSLIHNKILFFDPKIAAKFVNKLWSSGIDDWWFNKKTQNSIKKFNDIFAKKSNNICEELEKIIRT